MVSYKPTLVEFINNMITVKDAHNDDIWWYDYQYDVLDEMDTNDKVIIVKARQLGISTMLAVYALYKALFDRGSVNVILSPKAGTDRRIIRLIEAIYNTLHGRPLIPTKVSRTQSEIIFSNGSIISTAYVFERGDRNYHDGVLTQDFYGNYTYPNKITNLFVDEYAFFDALHIEKFNRHMGFKPTKVVIASTLYSPNDNAFYELWKKNEKGMGEYYPIKLKWDMRPDRTEEWKIKQDQLLGTALTKREHECEFEQTNEVKMENTRIENTRIEKFYVESGDMIVIYYTLYINGKTNVNEVATTNANNTATAIKNFYLKHSKDVLVLAIPQYINL